MLDDLPAVYTEYQVDDKRQSCARRDGKAPPWDIQLGLGCSDSRGFHGQTNADVFLYRRRAAKIFKSLSKRSLVLLQNASIDFYRRIGMAWPAISPALPGGRRLAIVSSKRLPVAAVRRSPLSRVFKFSEASSGQPKSAERKRTSPNRKYWADEEQRSVYTFGCHEA